ncbi:MAG: outer membrane protein assembly factor BamA [Planctomycetota bacterium]|nr:MAG: outer membrane protein assembly factor BamA [Planctomycetota bacterium]
MFPDPVSSFRPTARILVLIASVGLAMPIGSWCDASVWEVQPAVDDLDVYESRPIRELVLQGPPGPDGQPAALDPKLEQNALNNIRSRVGGAFRAQTVRDDVARLNRLNVFKSIDTSVQLLEDGGVRLIFTLTEQPVIQAVQVTGNLKMTDQKIFDEIDLVIGAPVDRFQVDRAARQIEALYREKGYYFARVTIDERELVESGIVVYQIREGERVKITDIRFEGNQSAEPREIRREIKTRTANLFKKGKIDDNELDADVGRIIDFYRNLGFLDVRAGYRIQPAPNGREAIIVFLIEEGPLYTLRDISLEYTDIDPAEAPFTVEQIAGLMSVKRGDVYGVRKVESSLETVIQSFGKLGYTDVRIERYELRDPDRPQVDLKVVISAGPKYRTGLIITGGNELTRKDVILRNTELRPGRPLDTTYLEATRFRLEQINLFERGSVKVTPQPPDPQEPDVRDVYIEVAETNTGNFAVGGAVSSDSGVVGRISLTQRNFDLMDFPDTPGELFSGRAFRGGGQTFRIEILPGDRIETYSTSLSEPHLFETDYSGSVQIFYRSRDYDEYDELRFGGRFSIGRRFGTRWSGALNLRIESVDLTNILPDRPTDVFAVADRNAVTAIGFALGRTSIDNRFRPTRGSASTINIEQVGALGGDFTFTKLNADHTVFIPIFEDYLDRRTVLSFKTQIGYIPQGRSETPTYERFYLGGQTFRGFQFRSVSPKGIRNDTGVMSDQPVGGTWLFFAGAEIQQPIFEEIFSLVGFIDTGTVTFEPGFDDYRVSVGMGMRFSIPQLSPAPLAFDFGFPIKKGPRDESRAFTFSIDVPF